MGAEGDSGLGSRSSTAAKNRPSDDEHDHHGHHEQHQPRQRHAGTIACVIHHRSTDSAGRRAPTTTAPNAWSVQSRTPVYWCFALSCRRATSVRLEAAVGVCQSLT